MNRLIDVILIRYTILIIYQKNDLQYVFINSIYLVFFYFFFVCKFIFYFNYFFWFIIQKIIFNPFTIFLFIEKIVN